MSEQHLLLAGALLVGLTLGVIGMLVFNKMRGGSMSPGALKQEMEDYQGQVEAHFEQTSQKFQQMASQYQDLYQHLAVGATSLCRPENISPSLTDQTDPLAKSKLIEQEPVVQQDDGKAEHGPQSVESETPIAESESTEGKTAENEDAEESEAKPKASDQAAAVDDKEKEEK